MVTNRGDQKRLSDHVAGERGDDARLFFACMHDAHPLIRTRQSETGLVKIGRNAVYQETQTG